MKRYEEKNFFNKTVDIFLLEDVRIEGKQLTHIWHFQCIKHFLYMIILSINL